MGRPKAKATPIRAARMKVIRESNNLSQARFGERIYFTQQQIWDMENGRRSVTDETCRTIHEAFPDYRLAWIRGDDDIATRDDAHALVMRWALQQDESLRSALFELLAAAYVDVDMHDIPATSVARLSKDGESLLLSDAKARELESELYDFISFKVYQLFNGYR